MKPLVMARAGPDEWGWQQHGGTTVLTITHAVATYNEHALRSFHYWQAVTVHEVLHCLGLGHTNGGGQIMQAVIHGRSSRLGAGDLNGLHHVAAG